MSAHTPCLSYTVNWNVRHACTAAVHIHARGQLEGRAMMDWSSLLSSGVAVHILGYISSTHERRQACRAASRECRALVDSSVQTLRVSVTSLRSRSSSAGLPLEFPALKRLALHSDDSTIASTDLRHCVGAYPQLLAGVQQLDLLQCQGLDVAAVKQLLSACPKLRQLRLPRCPCWVDPQQLNYASVLPGACPQLQVLQCAGDYASPSSIPDLAALTNLQELDLSSSLGSVQWQPSDLAPLTRLTALAALQLGKHAPTAATYEVVAALPCLSTLAVPYEQGMGPAPQALEPLTSSKTLHKLHLTAAVLDAAVAEVLGRMRLTSLIFTGSFALTPAAAGCLPRGLRHLSLAVANDEVHSFAAVLPRLNLTSLDVTLHHTQDPCQDLLAAISSQQRLQRLQLCCNYSCMTQNDVEGVQPLPLLTHVTLCNGFSNASLTMLLRCMPATTHLRLQSCREVTDLGLACAASHCRRLEVVELVLMSAPTVVAVAAMASHPRLGHITLRGCRRISSDDVQEVQQLLSKPGLQVIKAPVAADGMWSSSW